MIPDEITGIVLAGGKSSRMGKDKSLLVYGGKPLITYAIDALRPLCGKVIINSNHAVYDFTGCEVWPDELPVQAPMIGIYSCLKRSASKWNMVLSCDMPMVSASLIEWLWLHKSESDMVIPVHDGACMEPLCGLYSKTTLPLLEEKILSGDYSLQRFIGQASASLLEIGPHLDVYSPNLFLNINTEEDFSLLTTK